MVNTQSATTGAVAAMTSRFLDGLGIDVVGWDPNFRPEGERLPSDIVNLGYVVNVIEDRDERNEALTRRSHSLKGYLLSQQ